MNKRIEKLIDDAKLTAVSEMFEDELVKFAELIIKECYEHCKDQLMDKSLAEEAGLDYNDGVMDCAIGLKQHFGVE